MKKYIVLAIAVFALSFTFTSCEEYEAGGTLTEKMAGNWWVYYNADSSYVAGNPASYIDYIYTYNTAANTETDMFIDIPAPVAFSATRFYIVVDIDTWTFSTSGSQSNVIDSSDAVTYTIANGKIEEDAYTSPTGYPVDKISFELTLSTGETFYYEGFRKTGFTDDELSISTSIF
ncbi:MAG: lipid-binding protein [Rikenellaceae bacterium]